MNGTIARSLARLAALPFLVLAALALTSPLTWSGYCYILGSGALIVGLALPRTSTRARAVTRGALLFLLMTIAGRALSGRRGTSIAMHARTGESARIVDRVVEEQDLAITATRVLVTTGLIHDHDAPVLVPAMRSAYGTMRATEGDVPSPVLATYLGQQSPDASDTLVLESTAPPRAALIFLHGFAGNFTLPCWEIARAVRDLDVLTVCPSVGYRGDWWTKEGQATVARAVAYVKSRGLRHIILAGLSNGGIGASRLAPRMPGVFEGLILISGADPGAGRPGVPVLLLQGRHDSMVSPGPVRTYASQVGGRYVDLDAGHFAMLVRGDQTQRAIGAFMRERARSW